jgi:hypothetical protein
MSDTPPLSLEIAAFTVGPGDEEALLRERPAMVTALQGAFPGALAAWLTREDDGTWVDVILWRSREEAEEAAQEIEQVPDVRQWIGHITEARELRHLEVVHEALWALRRL